MTIKKEGGKFVVRSRAGKLLGRHPTLEAAREQLRTVEDAKRKRRRRRRT